MNAPSEVKQRRVVTWQRTRNGKCVRVAKNHYNAGEAEYYSTNHVLEIVKEQITATVEVTIDINQIFDYFAGAAAQNSSGKAQGLGGLIVGRRINEQILSSKTESHPIPDGYSELSKWKEQAE